MTLSLQRWEILALLLAVAGAGLWLLLRQALRSFVRARLDPRLVRLWRSPLADWVLVLAVLLWTWLPLRAVWAVISPHRFLSGPDSEGYLSAAIAYHTGNWLLYPDDRYPGYPWLVSLLSPDLQSIPWTGTTVSMAAMVLCVVPLYWIGRLLVGRAAGVVGATLAMRQILVVDVGQTFTSYPLVTLLDASLLALALALLSTRGWRSLVLGAAFLAAGTLACTTDPKQIPLVMAMGGLLALWLLVAPGRRLPMRLLLAVSVVAPVAVGQMAMTGFPGTILTVESLVMRTPGSTQTADFKARRFDGFVLGQEGALRRLPATLRAIQTQILPDQRVNRKQRLSLGLSLAWPRTSPLWIALSLGFPLLLLVRKRGALRVMGPVLLLVYLSPALPLVRFYYSHRWALPELTLLPVAAVGSTALLGGPVGVVGAAMAALLMPDSPMSRVDASYLRTGSRQTDSWTMGEDTQLWMVVDRASRTLPAGTPVFDFSGTQPVTALALYFPYTMCRTPKLGQDCRNLGPVRPIAAVLRLGDVVTARLPGGTGSSLPFSAGLPRELGCWQYMDWIRGGTGLYTWSCPDAPGSGPAAVPAGR
ncbi:MAG: glycosyltransferase family 39 protein [Oligoflexia bacterium]|nr:glycosyltransferase family 39 protein [Oligoflexia bacterium]